MTATDYSILDDLADDPGVLAAAKLRVIYGAIYKAAALAGGFLLCRLGPTPPARAPAQRSTHRRRG